MDPPVHRPPHVVTVRRAALSDERLWKGPPLLSSVTSVGAPLAPSPPPLGEKGRGDGEEMDVVLVKSGDGCGPSSMDMVLGCGPSKV